MVKFLNEYEAAYDFMLDLGVKMGLNPSSKMNCHFDL